MEFYYAKADKKVQNDRKCRTLLLKNGDIAVVYLNGGKGAQIGFRFLMISKKIWQASVF